MARILTLITLVCLAFTAAACAQIELVGHIEPASTASYGDVWAEGDYAYLGTRGNEGLFIIDISNPAQPFVASQYFPSSGAAPQDVKVQNGIGYVAMDQGGIVDIVDLSDPTQPTRLSTITGAGSHNVFIDNDRLYTQSQIYDVSDPSNPVFMHNFAGGHDITVLDDRLYVSNFGVGTRIFDVSNLSATQPPIQLGVILTGANSHSNWVSDDRQLLVNAQEGGRREVGLFDISDIENPAIHANIRAENFHLPNGQLPHNPLLVGDRLYVSWYGVGLQVFDVSDRTRPIHLGRFDTADNWGVYPFLGPDRILASDIVDGLYILDATDVQEYSQSDFNNDGTIHLDDIDELVAAIANGSTDTRYDLDRDGEVSRDDIRHWRAIAGAANLEYNSQFRVGAFLAGDANLDGNVDAQDFLRWNENKFQNVTGWSNGDFNADGVVDGLDFTIWNVRKFSSANPPGAAVPEPSSLCVLGILAFFSRSFRITLQRN